MKYEEKNMTWVPWDSIEPGNDFKLLLDILERRDIDESKIEGAK